MRVLWIVACLALGLAVASAQTPTPQPPAPESQQPVFRTGVDLLTVDATVVDRDGRQITDLTVAEFIVEVDGRPRPVVSAEYVKLVDDAPVFVGARRAAAPAPVQNPFFSTNARTLSPGRVILLLVDEGNIRLGQGRDVMRSAVKFVDGLSPNDRVAVVAIPRGAIVDFTSDHERVREALLATVGRASPFKGRFFMSLSEAIAAYEHSDATLRNQLFMRECAAVLNNPVELTRCEIEVEQEAGEFVHYQRQQTQASLHGMREVLRSLAALDGPKSVILISEGLVLEGLGGEVEEIAATAADVRASLDVMLLDVPSVDVSQAQRPTTPREDRDRQVTGLEMIAGLSRGALHRVFSSSDPAFTRIMRSLAGHYLIGVEAQPSDRDGRRHRISVKTTRRGVTLFSRRGFLATTSPAATSPADAVARALRAPLTMNDVPMRLATWTYKEPGGSKVRLLITAELERTREQPLDYTAGLLLVDRNNRAVASNVETRPLDRSTADPSVAVFVRSLLVDSGTYLLRFAAADSEGRLGSVERKIDAWDMAAGGLTVGDLLIGPAPAAGAAVIPAIEPVVENGQLVALFEVYQTPLTADSIQATLDVVADENTRPLLTVPLNVSIGGSPEVGVLQGVMNTSALPPGRYLARASVSQAGKPHGHLTRPFRVVVPARTANDASATAAAMVPREFLAGLVDNLPPVPLEELVSPAVLSTVLTAAESARPGAKAAFASARKGGLGPAALEALSSGDQAAAAFLRGVDFFAQGQNGRALQQLQVSMQQAPGFAPARLFLGAALSQAGRHREAAGLLQSVASDVAGSAPVARLTAISWLRAGDAPNAIAALERANVAGDVDVARTLALAYIAADRAIEAAPLLTQYLADNPNDGEALVAGIYVTYAAHVPTPRTDSLQADRDRAQGWAKAYSALRGQHQALVDAWMAYLRGL
ncbi:MAG TPA: VWA domain-containing protein [Vicinamibacterales bacterium]|nr:VWA domain-containing protein [Vicinamibacterales bacterium]